MAFPYYLFLIKETNKPKGNHSFPVSLSTVWQSKGSAPVSLGCICCCHTGWLHSPTVLTCQFVVKYVCVCSKYHKQNVSRNQDENPFILDSHAYEPFCITSWLLVTFRRASTSNPISQVWDGFKLWLASSCQILGLKTSTIMSNMAIFHIHVIFWQHPSIVYEQYSINLSLNSHLMAHSILPWSSGIRFVPVGSMLGG